MTRLTSHTHGWATINACISVCFAFRQLIGHLRCCGSKDHEYVVNLTRYGGRRMSVAILRFLRGDCVCCVWTWLSGYNSGQTGARRRSAGCASYELKEKSGPAISSMTQKWPPNVPRALTRRQLLSQRRPCNEALGRRKQVHSDCVRVPSKRTNVRAHRSLGRTPSRRRV